MKKAISLLMVFLVVLTLLGPVSAQPKTSAQLDSNEMLQISGGKSGCSSGGGIGCCCLDLWVAQICICVASPVFA